MIESLVPVAGFQFDVDGATVLDASGGDATENGFIISSGGSTVLGFNITGGVIPASCGTLVELSLDGDATGLSGITIAGVEANALPFTYYIPGVDEPDLVSDCTDAYPDCTSNEVDCAGICDGSTAEDCAGECGGDAVVDECGVCNGDGTWCLEADIAFGSFENGNLEKLENAHEIKS